MPIKKDKEGNRYVEMQLVVPGTPEQVWAAIATGPGNAAWFTKAKIEERVGGALEFDMGSLGGSKGEVTAWDPPFRFAYIERDWAPGAPAVATEITVIGRSGGKCVMRMVHSFFSTTDEWDDQVEGFESGWPGFFSVLKQYLTHFVGQEAGTFIARAEMVAPQGTAWTRLMDSLGFAAAGVGDTREVTAAPERLTGHVEEIHQDAQQRSILLRVEGDAPGIILAGTYGTQQGTSVAVCRYTYGVGARKRSAVVEPQWQQWVERLISQPG